MILPSAAIQRALPAFLIFTCVYILYSFHSHSARDPTSVFFDPPTGYAPTYSMLRSEQANQFIFNHSRGGGSVPPGTDKKLCVGIPSFPRKDAGHLRTTIGSLLEGLTPEERSEIYLIAFIPHSDPRNHPQYSEKWLSDLTDELLLYHVPDWELKHIIEMQAAGGLYREKSLYDWSYLLKACHKQATKYVAIIEDDTVAMDGWYHRTIAALQDTEKQSALQRASPDFFYLRLFYTEHYFGWNSEYWPTYLFWSLVVASIAITAILFFRSSSAVLKRVPLRRVLLTTLGLCASGILLFFAAGRLTVLSHPPGVHEMPHFGCCSQALVFPHAKAMSVVRLFEERRFGFVNTILEEHADRTGQLRWALTPSVVQHMGRATSKVEEYGDKIWNFAFEQNNPEDLRREHWQATHMKQHA
ncbi:integral membrane protein-like protein [Polyplosphaeria fusca]|uniref:Integral membrane protein-like protein n=1 Tax=Polyplosphaeria fusca TaxID=682080 RepID=A0A9P4QLJ6_9PLEO|nr:integral membrane protein-like protein [Polyplosphaeria fusca]